MVKHYTDSVKAWADRNGQLPGVRLSARQLLFILVLAVVCPALTPAQAGNNTVLDDSLRQHLLSLDTIVPATAVERLALKQGVVVVTFFASWCPPCKAEFAALNDVQKQLAGGPVTIVAVNVFEAFDDQDEIRMERFLNATDPQFHVVKGTAETRALFGNVNRIPTLLAFDATGKLAFNFVHARGADKMSVDSTELLAAIRPLLH